MRVNLTNLAASTHVLPFFFLWFLSLTFSDCIVLIFFGPFAYNRDWWLFFQYAAKNAHVGHTGSQHWSRDPIGTLRLFAEKFVYASTSALNFALHDLVQRSLRNGIKDGGHDLDMERFLFVYFAYLCKFLQLHIQIKCGQYLYFLID